MPCAALVCPAPYLQREQNPDRASRQWPRSRRRRGREERRLHCLARRTLLSRCPPTMPRIGEPIEPTRQASAILVRMFFADDERGSACYSHLAMQVDSASSRCAVVPDLLQAGSALLSVQPRRGLLVMLRPSLCCGRSQLPRASVRGQISLGCSGRSGYLQL